MAKRIEQINNLTIKKYTANDPYKGHLVVAPDGRVLEDRLTLQQARSWASKTKDFVVHKSRRGSPGKPTLKDLNNALKVKGLTPRHEATFHKGKFHVLAILRNGVPVPLFISKDSREVLDYIKGSL
jgi:hypothetical protein